MKKIKVLFVHGGILAKAGTESYMMSVLNNVDPKHVSIDFAVFGTEEGYYDRELLDRGIKIFRFKYRPQDFTRDQKSFLEIKKEIQKEHYDIVHVHMNAFNAPLIKMFKRWGIPIAVAHSHTNMFMSQNPFVIAAKKRLKKKTPKVADLLLACSKDAGEFQYGSAPFTVVNNGIDTAHFAYDESVRKEMRKDLNLENQFVLGNVGRFNFQKNHSFLLDVFDAYLKLDSNSVLMLVGEGELEAEIRNKAEALGILDKIMFMGIKGDLAPYYQAMDCFVLPSNFEGLGIVLIEAQASGLECYASTYVPREAKVADTCHFLDLKDPQKWAQLIFAKRDNPRFDQSETIKAMNYDATTSAQSVVDLYDQLIETHITSQTSSN